MREIYLAKICHIHFCSFISSFYGGSLPFQIPFSAANVWCIGLNNWSQWQKTAMFTAQGEETIRSSNPKISTRRIIHNFLCFCVPRIFIHSVDVVHFSLLLPRIINFFFFVILNVSIKTILDNKSYVSFLRLTMFCCYFITK